MSSVKFLGDTNRLFQLEVRFGMSIYPKVGCSNVPDYVRNVPAHKDDPEAGKNYLVPNMKESLSGSGFLGDATLWVLNNYGISLRLGVGRYDTVYPPTARYNYRNNGEAYVYYDAGIDQKFGPTFYYRFPVMDDFDDKNSFHKILYLVAGMSIGNSLDIVTSNGWDRYGKTEKNADYLLGSLNFNSYVFGGKYMFEGTDLSFSLGFELAYNNISTLNLNMNIPNNNTSVGDISRWRGNLTMAIGFNWYKSQR